jgi:peptide/nickel transport system substrate-binding protein
MAIGSNSFRYYYWLTLEFAKKHSRLIFLSFLISVITAISVVTISPYISSTLTRKKHVIGLVGSYDPQSIDKLPEDILYKISSGLTVINDKGVVLPMLATTWEKSKDEKTYTFHLRRNVLLNNGELFKAKHVNLAFRDVKMKVLDDYTIEFELQKKLAVFPLYLTRPIIVYPQTGIAGLYSIDALKVKNQVITEIRLSPNRKDVEPITYIFFPTEGEMITSYKLGKITEMSISNATMAEAFKSWKNTTVEKNVVYDRLLTLFFNQNNPIVKEREFRIAIENAIDYKQFSNLGEFASTSIPPLSWAFNPDVRKKETDREFAQKTFKRMITASDSAKLTLLTYYEYLDMADIVANSLRDAGLPITVNFASYSSAQPEFDVMLAYIKIPTDADQYYYWHSTQSLAQLIGYKNLKIDKLLEDGRGAYKVAERKETYREMQRVMRDDPPALFILYPYMYTVRRK